MKTWADERALYIWSGSVKADLAPIRDAKLALEVTELVKPFGVTSLADLPDLDARVLAIGSRPPFICNYALCSENTSAAGWQRALAWVLGVNSVDEKATLIEDVLGSIFLPDHETGKMLREITQEELDGEKRYADYQLGRV